MLHDKTKVRLSNLEIHHSLNVKSIPLNYALSTDGDPMPVQCHLHGFQASLGNSVRPTSDKNSRNGAPGWSSRPREQNGPVERWYHPKSSQALASTGIVVEAGSELVLERSSM